MSYSDYLPPGCSDEDVDRHMGPICSVCFQPVSFDFAESFEEEDIICGECEGAEL